IDHVGIVLFDSTRNSGKVVAEFPDNGIVGMKVPIPEAIYNRMNVERRPIAVNRIEDAEKFGLDRTVFEPQGIRSIAFVPMIVQGDLVGAVGLDVYYNDHDFTAEELDSAAAITAQLGISIRNAQLYTEVRRQASQLERIADLSRRVTSTFDQTE